MAAKISNRTTGVPTNSDYYVFETPAGITYKLAHLSLMTTAKDYCAANIPHVEPNSSPTFTGFTKVGDTNNYFTSTNGDLVFNGNARIKGLLVSAAIKRQAENDTPHSFQISTNSTVLQGFTDICYEVNSDKVNADYANNRITMLTGGVFLVSATITYSCDTPGISIYEQLENTNNSVTPVTVSSYAKAVNSVIGANDMRTVTLTEVIYIPFIESTYYPAHFFVSLKASSGTPTIAVHRASLSVSSLIGGV